MLRNTTRYKKVILSLVIATTLTSFNSSLVEAATLGGIYKSKSVVKNYIELENEIAEALKIGADTAEINIDNTFENEFYRNYNAKFNSIITNAKFKADDYHHFLISKNSGSIKGNIAKYDFVYHETTSETKQVENKVTEIIRNIIKPNMTEDEKFKTIHDYIVTNVQYDSNGLKVGNESHSAYAALFRDKGGDEKQTVCQGYSLLFYRMATEAGLEARIMTGTAGGPHAWNLIKVNDKWYQVDLTWDDPVGMDDPNYKRYDYYALTDEQLKKDHTIFDNSDKYPICNTEYKNASTNEIILHEIGKLNISAPVIATTREEFKAILIDNIKRGKNKASITYGNDSDIPYILGEVEREFSSVINNLDCKYTQSGSLYTYNIGINYKNPINSIVTSSNSYNLKLGTPQGIKVTANMKSGATKDVTADAYYLSSNSQVAVVDRNTGKIIPKLAGKANILVMINGLEQTVSVNVLPQVVKSNNAKLSSLNVNGALVDGFSQDKLSYAVKLTAGTNTVPTVTAAEADSKANKVIVQAKNLTGSEAERTSTVKVTAEDGTIKEYKVVFSVEQPAVVKSNNAKLSSLNVNGALVDGFSSDKLSYAVKLAAGTNTVPTVTAAEADSKANKVIVQAKNLTGSEAERTSTVKVTAEDGTIKEYKVVFSVAQPAVVKSNNAKLSSLNVNGALIDGFSQDKLSYAVKLAAGTKTVPTVTAAEADSKANKVIVQAKNLTGSEAERTSTVKVTAEDGTIKEYKVVFSVAQPVVVKSNNAKLSSLNVNGALVDGFSSDKLSYAVELAAGTNTVPTVTAAEADSKANTVTVQAKNLTGSEAERTSTVKVTAEDGTIKEYKVVFSVAQPVVVKSNNAKLSSLNVNGALVDGFSSDKLSYAVELAAGTNTVPTVTAAEADSKANTVTVQAKNLTGSEAERTSTVKVTAEDGTIKEYKIVFSVKPGEKPTDNSNNDVKPGEKPTDNSNGGVKPGEKPTDNSNGGVKPGEKPTDNSNGGVKPGEKPTDNSNGGVKPGEKPTDNSNGGVKPGEKPTNNSNGGVKPGAKPTNNSNSGVKPGAKPTNNSNSGVKPGAKPTNNSNSGVKPGAKPTNNSNSGVKPGAKSTNNSNSGVKPRLKPTNNSNSGVKSDQKKNISMASAVDKTNVKTSKLPLDTTEKKVSGEKADKVKISDNNLVDNRKKNENETSQSTNLDKDTKSKIEISNKEESPYNKKVVGSMLGVLGVGALAGIVILKKLKK